MHTFEQDCGTGGAESKWQALDPPLLGCYVRSPTGCNDESSVSLNLRCHDWFADLAGDIVEKENKGQECDNRGGYYRGRCDQSDVQVRYTERNTPTLDTWVRIPSSCMSTSPYASNNYKFQYPKQFFMLDSAECKSRDTFLGQVSALEDCTNAAKSNNAG